MLIEEKKQNKSTINNEPIFILGISQRSGTNFVSDLLSLHPDCDNTLIPEDFFMAHADLLIDFADSIDRIWQHWNIEKIVGSPKSLYECFGNSLTLFLNSQGKKNEPLDRQKEQYSLSSKLDKSPKRKITKTPSVKNLSHFFKLFPHCPLLIIIRDGRSVVESSVKTFERGYEYEMRAWANAAKTIIQAESDFKESNRKYLIVKYEEIFENTEQELKKIFNFLDLDDSKYDFSKALNLPVRGSSDLKNKIGKVHWQKVEKTAKFNPLSRYSHWDKSLHQRFNWIAGDYLEKLGYKKQTYHKNIFWMNISNRLLDAKYLGISGIFNVLKYHINLFLVNLNKKFSKKVS